MKRLLTLFLGLFVAVGLVGCDSNDSDDDTQGPTAQVRFVHASPDAGAVDVLVDGETVADDFQFQGSATNPVPNFSAYVPVPVGANADIEVQSGDNSTTVLTVNADASGLEEDQRYTVLVAGAVEAGGPGVILLEDTFQNLDAGQIGLRLVHGSQNAQAGVGPVDVYLTPPGTDLSQVEPLIAGFEFGEDSGQLLFGTSGAFNAQDLSGEAQVVSVTPAGSSQAAIEVPIGGSNGLQVSEGDFVTGIAADIPNGDGGTTIGALAIIEQAPDSNN